MIHKGPGVVMGQATGSIVGPLPGDQPTEDGRQGSHTHTDSAVNAGGVISYYYSKVSCSF